MKQPDISVIILSFNTQAFTLACLRAVLDSRLDGYTMEVILVDNASTDTTVKEVRAIFPSVTCIVNAENVGFAKGNNIGIQNATGRYILLLNSDTEVDPHAFSTIVRALEERPKAGAMTCKLLLSDGSIDPACHRGFPTPWAAFTYFSRLESLFPTSILFGQYHMGYMDMTVPHMVDAISGAFFMVKREVITDVGLLDEDFFMYGEDIDWAYRIKERGWEIWFHPDATTIHHKKKSGRSHGDKKRRITMETHFLTTMQLFYEKHYKKRYGVLVTWLVSLGIRMKLLLVHMFGI